MKTRIGILACLIVGCLNLRAETELKGSPTELSQLLSLPKTVSLTGTAELKVASDRAIISLRVVTENKDLQAALEANQSIRGKIMNALKDRGFPTNRIQGAKFSSTPQYGMFKEKAKSYRVENVIKVTALDEKESQFVAKLVDSYTEVRYEDTEFEHSDKDALKVRAQTLALEKASDKKRLFEEKLGVKLTPVHFADGDVTMVRTASRRAYTSTGEGYFSSAVRTLSNATETEPAEMPNSFGEMVITAQVTVEYTLTTK